MRTVSSIIFLMLALSFTNCSINQWDVNRYISRFERNQKDFDTLVALLKTENIQVGYPIYQNKLSERTRNLIYELDLSDTHVTTTACPYTPDYEFATSWSLKATVYFTKTVCNKEQTIKGYHARVSESVEVWGLGNGWMMWIDHDFI